MIVLISLVFIALAVGAFTTDLPFGQQLVGAYLFLSIGAVAATATRSGLLLLFGRGTTVRVEHLENEPGPGALVRLGRPARLWQPVALALWGLGWWAVAAYVVVTGAGVAESVTGRVGAGVAAAGFGAVVLVAARTRARRLAGVPSLLLTPTDLYLAGEQIPWADVEGIAPISGHRQSGADRRLLEVRWNDGAATAVVGAPTVADRNRVVAELRRLLGDPDLRAASASARYAADLAARLSARHQSPPRGHSVSTGYR